MKLNWAIPGDPQKLERFRRALRRVPEELEVFFNFVLPTVAGIAIAVRFFMEVPLLFVIPVLLLAAGLAVAALVRSQLVSRSPPAKTTKTPVPAPPVPPQLPPQSGTAVPLQPHPASKKGAKRSKSMRTYDHLSNAAIIRKALVILFSAIVCAIVGLYIYELVWTNNPMPGQWVTQLPWFRWRDQANIVYALHPLALALVVLLVFLTTERWAANANPGYGWLWALDFVPSVLLSLFLGLTLLRLWPITFDDPNKLLIFFVFLVGAVLVAASNAKHWFRERYGASEERVATMSMIVEAIREAQSDYSVNLRPRPGYRIEPENAYVANSEPIRLRQAAA